MTTNLLKQRIQERIDKDLKAIEYFYDNAFLDQAVDAYHYKSMVTSQSSETVIQGMTISCKTPF